jgi:hypothetical protein
MQSHRSILSAFTLSTGMVFGAAAIAADLPKEGTVGGTYSSFGTIKSTSIGKERLLLVFDEHGVTLSDGFLDQMTWHCWGLADFPNGMDAAAHGNCVGIDAAGDQISGDFLQEKHKIDAKDVRSSFTFTAGTGKFAGLSGGFTYVGNLLRTADEGTYGFHQHFQGSYKLP